MRSWRNLLRNPPQALPNSGPFTLKTTLLGHDIAPRTWQSAELIHSNIVLFQIVKKLM